LELESLVSELNSCVINLETELRVYKQFSGETSNLSMRESGSVARPGINVTPSQTGKEREQHTGGYGSLGGSGIHGGSIATSTLQPKTDEAFRSPEDEKQFQSPFKTGPKIT
jgi:hypothetical protein